MKVIGFIVLAFVFGLLFHGLSHVWPLVFGPVETTSSDQLRDIVYLTLSSLVAAAIATALWFWRARSFTVPEAFVVGTASLALVVTNIILAKGAGGLSEMFTHRPIHTVLSLSLALIAIPLCVYAANHALQPTVTPPA